MKFARWLIRNTSLLLALCAVPLLFAFQNCGRSFSPKDPATTQKLSGGDGYDGKIIYANYGDCGGDQILLKSLIEKTGPGQYQTLKENCMDLPEPRPVDPATLRFSRQDATVFGDHETVFDMVQATPTETKLTTAFCYSEGSDLEAMIWYNGTTLQQYADPRLADVLYAQVSVGSGKSEVIEVAKPLVFTDKLVYHSKDQAQGFTLTETRNGSDSSITYLAGGQSVTSTLICRAQAAPKFLDANTAYFLRVPGLTASENGIATLFHDANTGMDIFKKADASAPANESNSIVGWNAGYAKVNGTVLEMRKTANGEICFGPADNPLSPCKMWVLGTVDSNDFQGLYENTRDLGKLMVRKLNLLSSALEVDPEAGGSADICQIVTDNRKQVQAIVVPLISAAESIQFAMVNVRHAELQTVVSRGGRALLKNIPKDLLHFKKDCFYQQSHFAANVLTALRLTYEITQDEKIAAYFKAQRAELQSTVPAYLSDTVVKSYGGTLRVLIEFDRMKVLKMDPMLLKSTLSQIRRNQAKTASESICTDARNVFGRVFNLRGRNCNESPGADAALIAGLLETHRYMSTHELCKNNDSQWIQACTDLNEILSGTLAYLYNYREVINTRGNMKFKTETFANLFDALHGFGLTDESFISTGFNSEEKMTLKEIKGEIFKRGDVNEIKNSGYALRLALIGARLSELLATKK